MNHPGAGRYPVLGQTWLWQRLLLLASLWPSVWEGARRDRSAAT